MQIFPLDAEAPSIAAEPVPAMEPDSSPGPRTFCVVFRRSGNYDMLWKVQVLADDPIAAATAVAYSESISQHQLIGVIDMQTIR